MSWAEVKKAINSDLSTPLNTLITNAKNAIMANGGIKAVKSVQRGTISLNSQSGGSATISAVNMSKSVVISDFSYSIDNYSNNNNVYLSSSTSVTVQCTTAGRYDIPTAIWAVIEFY